MIETGITLRIDIENGNDSISCVLIGIEEKKYLIVRTPPLHTLGKSSDLLINGNEIYVKYVYKGTIYGFHSKIIDHIYKPFKLLFIEYPERIESYDFRGNKRVECYLPAFIKISGQNIEGSINDISKAGCLFDLKLPELEKFKNLLESNEEIIINFQLPGIEDTLNVTAKHRSLKKEPKKARIGIEFVYMESNDKAKLTDFLAKAKTL